MTKKKSLKIRFLKSWQLYVFLLPTILYYILFEYAPMYGVQIAFRDYKITLGVWESEWVGLKHFKNFFQSYYIDRLILNTLLLNIYSILWSFAPPIILAIMLNYIRSKRLKKLVQTVIYTPKFVSTIVIAGMLYLFAAPNGGIFNIIRELFGLAPINYMMEREAFRPLFIGSGIWQGAGYGTLLFIAGLSAIDPGLYEAAEIDGASIWQKIWHIDLPALRPTIAMTLIMDFGGIMSSATDKALALQTSGNMAVSDIIGLYVYKYGIEGGDFSYSAAIGLFTNIINMILLITVNKISKKLSNVGMF